MSETKKAKVFHFDLYGKREEKYNFLNDNSIASIAWKELEISEPNCFFVDKDFSEQAVYDTFFKISDLFPLSACGIVTARDFLLVHHTERQLFEMKADFLCLAEPDFRDKYNEKNDSRDWTYLSAKNEIQNSKPMKVCYRPFDIRHLPYSAKSKGILSYPRNEIMRNMLSEKNIALLICKQQSTFAFQHVFITKFLSDKCSVSLQTKEASYHFPLYLYPGTTNQTSIGESQNRIPNLNMEIVNKFAKGAGLYFAPEENPKGATVETNQFLPIDLLDYIYAVLNSPKYREKYKEFLKIDFPRVPYPTNRKEFFDLVNLGSKLRKLHLLESEEIEQYITQYPIDGNNVVGKLMFVCHSGPVEGQIKGKVYINYEKGIEGLQYFDNVPEAAWNFYIGGYQPAQKWLKDRKGRTLEFDDILHYQKIIKALSTTGEIMEEIDKIVIYE